MTCQTVFAIIYCFLLAKVRVSIIKIEVFIKSTIFVMVKASSIKKGKEVDATKHHRKLPLIIFAEFHAAKVKEL